MLWFIGRRDDLAPSRDPQLCFESELVARSLQGLCPRMVDVFTSRSASSRNTSTFQARPTDGPDSLKDTSSAERASDI